MSILEELYHGELHPASEILPDTPRYREARESAIRLSEELKARLTQAQYELFEAYCNARAAMSDEVNCESFRQGMILGATLRRELQGEDPVDITTA